MKLGLRIAVACAALAALALPALATGQGGSPTLTEAQDSEFPDRVWIYRTPTATKLSGLDVTENGGPVSGLAVDSGSKSSGAILLIDASNSMAGEPIEAAMAAARAFMAQRKDDLPVAVIAYNPEITVLTDFTRDSGELSAAIAKAPATAEGTRIYDALIEAARLAEEAGYARTTAVLLSDGHRRGVQATREETIAALNAANVRVISVGLQSPEYDAETLQTRSEADGRHVRRERDTGAARADLHDDRPAALERVRRQLSLPPSAEREGQRDGSRPGPRRGDGELHDARPRPHAAGHVRPTFADDVDHLAMAHDLRRRLRSRARRVRASSPRSTSGTARSGAAWRPT